MGTTEKSKQRGMKSWKSAWLRANRCYKGIRVNLWQLTTIINEMFDDAEFRADNGLRDDLEAADWIDEKLTELPIGFLELRTILHHYPDRTSWEGTKLSKLRDSIKPAKASTPAKPYAAKPDARQLTRERDFFKARAVVLEKQLQSANKPKVVAESEEQQSEVREPSKNLAIEHSRQLVMILSEGIDYEDSELMAALEELKKTLESVLQTTIA